MTIQSRWVRRLLAAQATLVLALCAPVAADQVNLTDLQGQVKRATQNISALGTDLLGDRVNLYNGALEFVHTDASLPGNSALRVAITRRHTAGRNAIVRGAFGDWDLETPRISGVFPADIGWLNSAGNTARCSNYSAPPTVTRIVSGGGGGGALRGAVPTTPNAAAVGTAQKGVAPKVLSGSVVVYFYAPEYWQGNFLQIPDEGSQEILKRNAGDTSAPSDGNTYPLVTRGQWQLRCLPSLRNASGEGFIALSP